MMRAEDEDYFDSSSQDSDSDEYNSNPEEDFEDTGEGLIGSSKRWNVFQNKPPEVNSGSEGNMKWTKRMEVAMLFISYLITNGVVLLSAMVSKGTTLFMMAQVSVKNRTFEFCNEDAKIPDQTKKFEVDWTRDIYEGITENQNDLNIINIEGTYQFDIVETEQIAWVWCLIFGFWVPEIFTFLRSARILFFKQIKLDEHAKKRLKRIRVNR